jgi:hypothetical protein
MVNKRKPMQVSIEFENKLKEMQRKVRMKNGEDVSLRQLTEYIAKSLQFDDIDKSLIEMDNKFSLGFSYDKRRKRV